MAAVTIGAVDPRAMAARWADVLDLSHEGTTVATDDAVFRFVPAGQRGEGLDAVDVVAADRARAGAAVDLCGVRFSFV